MTIVSSGAISINSLVGEYGGSAPHAMNEYYRGGSLVANHSNNGNVPTSGTIQLDDFYGANNTSPAPTSYSYSMTVGSGGTAVRGFFRNTSGGGSLSPNPQSSAFSSGFNPTIDQWSSAASTTKAGTLTFSVFLVTLGHLANSGWTSFTIPSGITSDGTALTLTRSSMTHNQISPGGVAKTQWQISGQARGFTSSNSSGTVTIAE